jgi:ribonucleoside-diphosphate reductase alpha chain
MSVTKRNGNKEKLSLDKIIKRIECLSKSSTIALTKLTKIDTLRLVKQVVSGLYENIKTSEIDEHTAKIAASLSTVHYEYLALASRISISNLHKKTLTGFKDKTDLLYSRKDQNGKRCPLILDDYYKFVVKHQNFIEECIGNYNLDYNINYFGFKTLERSYLLKVDNVIIERPLDLMMRVAIFIHYNPLNFEDKNSLKAISETYSYLSSLCFTHASPTLFNSGTIKSQLASCFLFGSEDSLAGIMKTATDCATVSKSGGGIGFHCSSWRSEGALIRGTNGKSSGIIPFLKIFNDVARAFNQGGKRMGSFAVYIEPHHPDILHFLNLRRAHGDENMRARDLFLGLWISDLFMKRVQSDAKWSVFDPDKCPGLQDAVGEAYETLYLEYESKKMYAKQYNARQIWEAIFVSQKESGMPYMLYKDRINKTSNQQNIGVIKSSNLCAEIVEYSDPTKYSVCTLASICLPECVYDDAKISDAFPIQPKFNYKKLTKIVGIVVNNLNNIIDKNYYPVIETKEANLEQRPLGIGVQGLADLFSKFRVPFDSTEARVLNKKIFETIYYAAVSKSSELAKVLHMQHKKQVHDNGYVIINNVKYDIDTLPSDSGAYPSYKLNGGCPLSKGIFHWELCDIKAEKLSGMFDWNTLRQHVLKFGVRNSQFVALMPTASTSQIMGNNECFEPYTSNMYKRKTLAGEFIVINKYLMHDLDKMNLQSKYIENYLKTNKGSIQGIEGIPDKIKALYKTVWEIKQKNLLDLAIDRTPFVDQSQSLNIFVEDLTYSKFNSIHFYGWKNGLKTGSYYMRSRPASMPQKFTIDPEFIKKMNQKGLHDLINFDSSVNVNNTEDEMCLLCGS